MMINGRRLAKSGDLSKTIKSRLVCKGLGQPLVDLIKRESPAWEVGSPAMSIVIKCGDDRETIAGSFFRLIGQLKVVGVRLVIFFEFMILISFLVNKIKTKLVVTGSLFFLGLPITTRIAPQ